MSEPCKITAVGSSRRARVLDGRGNQTDDNSRSDANSTIADDDEEVEEVKKASIVIDVIIEAIFIVGESAHSLARIPFSSSSTDSVPFH